MDGSSSSSMGHSSAENQDNMAAAGSSMEDVLKTYVERSATDGMLKLSPVLKCFTEAKLTKYKTTLESSVWLKHAKDKKCSPKVVATTVIDQTAAFHVGKKKSMKGMAEMDDPEVVAAIKEIRDGIAGLAGAAKKEMKVDKATARLTDTSKYTGSHKERFDADGKGKGQEGREDKADNSGYVGNYKGEGTYKK